MYGPYVGSLCKFFFFSSAIHQLVFCLFSSLPFAVGEGAQSSWATRMEKAFLNSELHTVHGGLPLFTDPYVFLVIAGQVQDVGLIFLSAMATDIAAICSEANLPAKEALGTALFTFAVSTLIVGILTLLVFRFTSPDCHFIAL